MHFRAQRKSAQDVSLSDYIETGTDGAPLQLMDVVSEDCDLLEQVSAKEMVVSLRKAMDSCLTEQERQVIQLRYGLNGQGAKRQREVAEITGISRSYISRIEKRALQKLRRELEITVRTQQALCQNELTEGLLLERREERYYR